MEKETLQSVALLHTSQIGIQPETWVCALSWIQSVAFLEYGTMLPWTEPYQPEAEWFNSPTSQGTEAYLIFQHNLLFSSSQGFWELEGSLPLGGFVSFQHLCLSWRTSLRYFWLRDVAEISKPCVLRSLPAYSFVLSPRKLFNFLRLQLQKKFLSTSWIPSAVSPGAASSDVPFPYPYL